MKTIALLSHTQIINKIFTLIANKLMVHLKIYNSIDKIDKDADLVVIDDIFLDENIIKLRAYCDTLVILKNDKLPDERFDFIIEKPFLPSTLNNNLETILKSVNEKIPVSKQVTENQKIYTSAEPTNEEITDDLAKFIDSMVNEIDENSLDENNLTVKKEELGHGGVLDKDELSKLYDMINDDNKQENNINNIKKEDDWVDLSDIIDKAIDDVSSYQFKESKPISLVLNQYSIEELAPLLKKLDQHVIDQLTDGNEITLQLRLNTNG